MDNFSNEQKNTLLRGLNRYLNDETLLQNQRKVLKDFNSYNEDQSLSVPTRRHQVFMIRKLAKFIKKDFKDMNIEDRRKFLREDFKDNKESYKNSVKMILIKFYEWLYKKDRKEIDIIKDLKVTARNSNKLPDEILTLEEVNELCRVATNLRDKLIIKLLFELGARASEFLQLKIKSFQQDENGFVCMLPQGKTTGRRLRILDSVPELSAWLNSHPFKDNPNHALFICLRRTPGKPLSTDGLKVILKSLNKVSKIKKNIYPHIFRHSRATQLAKLGFNEVQLRIYFGWSRTSTMPSKYIHMAGGDLENKMLELNGNIEAINKAKDEAQKLRPWDCPRCKENNSSQDKFCIKCGWDREMDYKTFQFKENEQDQLKKEMAQLKNKIKEEIIKELLNK